MISINIGERWQLNAWANEAIQRERCRAEAAIDLCQDLLQANRLLNKSVEQLERELASQAPRGLTSVRRLPEAVL